MAESGPQEESKEPQLDQLSPDQYRNRGFLISTVGQTIEIHDCNLDSVERATFPKLPNVSENFHEHSYCFISVSRVLLTGGYCDGVLNRAFIINIESPFACTEIRRMHDNRYNHGSVRCNQYAYVFGGFTGYNAMDSVEKLDMSKPETASWQQVTALPHAARQTTCVAYNNDIFISGGESSLVPWEVLKFDTVNEVYHAICFPTHDLRDQISLVMSNSGLIYLFDKHKTVLQIDENGDVIKSSGKRDYNAELALLGYKACVTNDDSTIFVVNAVDSSRQSFKIDS